MTNFKLDENGIWRNSKVAEINFDYSDGYEIEKNLLSIIKNATDKSVISEELRKHITDWATMYHLSRRRSNILRLFSDWFKGKKVLEIGSGCGAITRYLGEIGADVTAIEGSYLRALITKERCRDLENIEVMNTTPEFLNIVEYDAVLLIGVLEYAPIYTNGNSPVKTLLTQCKERLTEDGLLFIAIENQLGLKYFAGFPEDHTGKEMFGINNSYEPRGVKTYGKTTLIKHIYSCGMTLKSQFIPMPDYKLPTTIISPKGWFQFNEELSQLAVESARMDPQQNGNDLLSMEIATNLIWENNLATEMANSFLLVVGKTSEENYYNIDKVATYFSDTRKLGLNKEVSFINKKGTIEVHTKLLDNTPLPSEFFKLTIEEIQPFIKGKTVWYSLVEIVNSPNWGVSALMLFFRNWESLLKKAILPSPDTAQEIDCKYWDATPFNAIYEKNTDSLIFIDLEWQGNKKLKFDYIFFRGILNSFLRITTVAIPKLNIPLGILELTRNIMHELEYMVTLEQFYEWINLDQELASTITWNMTKEKNLEYIKEAKLKTRLLPSDLKKIING